MEKIKKYWCPPWILNSMRKAEHPTGQMCFYEDVQKYLLPETWPGKYPDAPGWWQYKTYDGTIEIVEVVTTSRGPSFYRIALSVMYPTTDTKPEQWGPRVRLWGEQ